MNSAELPFPLDRSVPIRAPRAVVFRYFTDTARFARWWGPGSSIEARPGGAVRIVYPNGVVAVGAVERIEADRAIVFTYGYEDPAKPIPPGGSRVTITLQDHRDGTLLQLRHDLRDAASRDQHVPGWRFQLALFANAVADEQHQGASAQLDRWFQAWAETDADRRLALLEACAAPDVEFQDRFACVTGRAELAAHIGMVQQFQPGVVMQRAGDLRHCQGVAVAGWQAADPAGQPRGAGQNVIRLAADGRIAAVTGLW